MNRKLESLIEKASQSLDMPLDLASGMPRIELRGRHEIIIESHSGVREYGESLIIAATSVGLVRICGSGLVIKAMNDDRMIINGTVVTVEYI